MKTIYNWDYQNLRTVEPTKPQLIDNRQHLFDDKAKEALKLILEEFVERGDCRYRVTPYADFVGVNIEIDTIIKTKED